LADAGRSESRRTDAFSYHEASAGKDVQMDTYVRRPLEELNLLDDFLMGAVASDEVKVQPEVEKDYMKFEEIIYYAKKEAAEEAEQRADIKRRQEDIFEFLGEYGSIPVALKERISRETDTEPLRGWLKLAAKVKNIEEFCQKAGL